MVKLSILNIRNKMNRLYILVILIVCMACQSSHQTTLKGVIKNYDGALVRIAVQGSLKRDTLKVNEKGEFQYIPVVPQKGEVYELFVKGYRPGVPLFLSGGDQVNVEITLLPREVPHEERFVHGDILATDHDVIRHLVNLINQQERRTMRQQGSHLIHIH